MKSKIIVLGGLVFMGMLWLNFTQAQTESGKLEYPDNVVVDGDLDGLTDLGEQKIFFTDPKNPDSDGDGVYDGTEILYGTNPLDTNSTLPQNQALGQGQTEENSKTAWYMTRAAALVSFVLLYISIFLGLAIRIPGLNRFLGAAESLNVHGWISLQAIIFALIHGVALMFDKFLAFSWQEVFVPFQSSYEPLWVGLGTAAFYLMLALILTSYLRNRLSFRLWRFVHHFNIILYIFGVLHALQLGTDLKNPINRDVFIFFNELLLVVVLIHLFFRFRAKGIFFKTDHREG